MDAGTVGPREPEQTNGNEDRSDDGRGQACFRRCRSTVLLNDSVVALIVIHGEPDSQEHANRNTEESQAANTGAPSSALLENNREGSETLHHISQYDFQIEC